MVTPQGSEAKEDKTKTKRKKRKLCMAMQAKNRLAHRGFLLKCVPSRVGGASLQ